MFFSKRTLRTALSSVLLSSTLVALAATSASAEGATSTDAPPTTVVVAATTSPTADDASSTTAASTVAPSTDAVTPTTITVDATPAVTDAAATDAATTDAATTDVAATDAAAGATVAAPSGQAMPVGNLPGWKQVFTDDFTTDVPLGQFPAAVASKWSAYPSPWKDTSKNGTYSPTKVVSIANGIMNSDIHTENGVSMVSALSPKLPKPMLYGRYSVRYRFDSMPGYKMAWMLWPDSGDNKTDGELDFPEMNLDSNAAWAFDHRTNSTGSGDQAWFNTPLTPGGWHTATIEWSPNLVVYTFDGTEIGRTWERTPSTPMHWVLQTETVLDASTPPAASVRGDVQVDWVSAYTYDPSTSDTTPPAVTATAPVAAATVKGTATLAASATDNRGVAGVQFKVDGKNVGSELTAAPFTVQWNSALATDGNHTVSVTARDVAGNQTTKSVTTKVANTVSDTTKPTMISSVPQTRGTRFPVRATISTQFSEAVTGVNGTSVKLTNALTGAAVPATVSYQLTTNGSIASVKPTKALSDTTRYTVSLTSGIKDRNGNALAATSFSFSTGPAPTAKVTSPVAGATNVSRSTKVTATASKDLARVGRTTVLLTSSSGTKVSATVSFDAATKRVTLTPTSTLAARTKYTVLLTDGIKDVAGNGLVPLTWSFTTGA